MKKFISLFLVFSLMALSANLYAKEKRGVKLIITKTDGQQIRGELITIKPNSLLLLDTEGKDVSIDIGDIKVIRIVKKAFSGAGVGFLIGAVPAIIIGIYMEAPAAGYLRAIGLFGGIGALLGIFRVAAGTDKTIQIEGMSDSEIKEAMDKLRKKARIRDYK